MTCDKDCQNCIYGTVIYKRIKCLNTNTTCNGDCKNCRLAQTLSVKYACSVNIYTSKITQ